MPSPLPTPVPYPIPRGRRWKGVCVDWREDGGVVVFARSRRGRLSLVAWLLVIFVASVVGATLGNPDKLLEWLRNEPWQTWAGVTPYLLFFLWLVKSTVQEVRVEARRRAEGKPAGWDVVGMGPELFLDVARPAGRDWRGLRMAVPMSRVRDVRLKRGRFRKDMRAVEIVVDGYGAVPFAEGRPEEEVREVYEVLVRAKEPLG